MNHYEILFIVHPDQSEQVPPLVQKYKDVLTKNGGTIHREEDWGRRKLAFPIHKMHKGHYVLLNAECDPAEVDELSEAFRFNDAILRHVIQREEGAPADASPIAKELKQKEKGERERGGREQAEEKPAAPAAEAGVPDAGEAPAGAEEAAAEGGEEDEASAEAPSEES
ncbi:MAG TPA: 30S ribosomal protein S6 [Gammaproteobacteria bacterium]|nr:30S ribosomal protein S6 [Gammaproteobacteria bacterium]